MKRDARIGLAVVLLLGLAVTLLIARSFCKGGTETASADADAPLGAAAYTTDVARVPFARVPVTTLSVTVVLSSVMLMGLASVPSMRSAQFLAIVVPSSLR